MTVLLWIVWIGVVGLSVARPGVGFALALIAGRHSIPSRSAPVIAAAPVLVAAAFLGLALRRKLRRPDRTALVLAGTWATIVVLGLRPLGELTAAQQDVGIDRAYFVLVVLVPLCLLADSLDRVERAWLAAAIVGIGVALGLVALATLGSAEEGRASAFGGGPITLAQTVGIGLLLVASPIPHLFGEREPPIRLRVVVGALLAIVLALTYSRYPMIVVAVVLAAQWVAVGVPGVALASRRRITIAASALLAIGVALPFVGGTRWNLFLSDPLAEIRRSRGRQFGVGWDQLGEAGPLTGTGMGSFFGRLTGEIGSTQRYAHNLFLEVGGESGWLALAVLVVALVAVARRLDWRSPWLWPCLATFLINQLSGDLFDARYFVVFAALAAGSASRRLDLHASGVGTGATATTFRGQSDQRPSTSDHGHGLASGVDRDER